MSTCGFETRNCAMLVWKNTTSVRKLDNVRTFEHRNVELLNLLIVLLDDIYKVSIISVY